MSHVGPKLKLKRKKFTAPPERSSPGIQRRFRPTSVTGVPLSPRSASDSALDPGPASASLWTLTRHCLLQEVQEPAGQLPELPPPSAPTPSVCSDAADWNLTDEVPPFPGYSSHQAFPESTMDGSEQDTPLQTHSPLHTQTESCSPRAMLPHSHRGQGPGESMLRCPMCQLVFPLGFTQLDRDSHLARCLSEVNMDVTW